MSARTLLLLCLASAGWAFGFGVGSQVCTHWLKEHGTAEQKTRYAQIVVAEARTPLPPYDDNGRRGAPDDTTGARAQTRPTVRPSRANSCCTWDQNSAVGSGQ